MVNQNNQTLMSYIENAKIIGKVGSIFIGGLTVKVTVLDYKNSYGRDRWQVTPVEGEGKIWVESVSIIEK